MRRCWVPEYILSCDADGFTSLAKRTNRLAVQAVSRYRKEIARRNGRGLSEGTRTCNALGDPEALTEEEEEVEEQGSWKNNPSRHAHLHKQRGETQDFRVLLGRAAPDGGEYPVRTSSFWLRRDRPL